MGGSGTLSFMERRALGPFQVSVVGLGCNNFGHRTDQQQTNAVVGSALDSGINFFDTADVYSHGLSEEYLGKALGSRRSEAVVASKFGMVMPDGSGASPKWIEQAVDDSLRRLGIDHIDLYQMHRPDPDTPIEETMGALDALVASGKVRAIGCSNMTAEGLNEWQRISAAGKHRPWVSVQNQYSLLHRHPEGDGVLDVCVGEGLGLLPFFPLAAGVLTGKYRLGNSAPEGTRLSGFTPDKTERFLNEDSQAAIDRLEVFVGKRGRSLLELAFGYLLASEAVPSVIAGARNPDQVAANVAAAEWKLTSDEVDEARSLS